MSNESTRLALSVASIFLAACGPAKTHQDVECPDLPKSKSGVKCLGINSCKGQSECMTKGPGGKVTHQCGGQNSCSGSGWVTVSDEKTCEGKGGKVM